VHGSLYPSAPNPCLRIDGLGDIGLPLSARDAHSITQCAIQAPFGHGERTTVDKTIRDTWEIDGSKVAFDNKGWNEFMNQTVVKSVCNALGVQVSPTSPPRAELYKLLLYQDGSQ
jgi:hypothetical protein